MKSTALLLLLALPACGAAPLSGYTVGGAHVDTSTVWFPAVRRNERGSDEVFVVTCSRHRSDTVNHGTCSWTPAGDPEASLASTDRRQAAMATASLEHDCALDAVEVQARGAGEESEGYWLLVCGAQRYYRWDARGRFVEIARGESAAASPDAPTPAAAPSTAAGQ